MTALVDRIADAEREWRRHPVYIDFELSTDGGIQRLDGQGCHMSAIHGYPTVEVDGRRLSVHILICETFYGPRPSTSRHEVRHLNGIRTDNRLENLRWGTVSENALDRVRHGTHNMSRKTRCPQKHPYDEANTYMHDGKRHCRICMREARRRCERKQSAK